MGLLLLERSNDALKINPPTGDQFHLTTSGSDWLWTVLAVYLISLLIVVGATFLAPKGEKIFHYLFTISLFVGSVAYFTIASDLGSTPILTVNNAHGTRQIFYAMYINWFCGWPSVIIAVGLISGVSWATIVFNIILSWIWIVSWLSGALVATTYKWGFFVFGILAYFLLAANILVVGNVTAKRVGITRHFLGFGGWLIFFGILDILLVPSLACGFLLLSREWDYRALNIYFTQYGRVAQAGQFQEREKTACAEPASAPVVAQPAAVAAPEGQQAV